MNTETIIYICLSIILALFIALFQYKYKSKSSSKWNNLFAALRFITIFTLLLLIINPKLERLETYVEKPNLVVAVDNSKSIVNLKKDIEVKNYFESIVGNRDLNDKFNIDSYVFGDGIQPLDSLNFSELQTNISSSLDQLNSVYKGSVAPTVIITDGNQTYGDSYAFSANKYHHPIYPIIAGDTTKFIDLKIQQLNVNRYAYLKNRFPIEIVTFYNGDDLVNTKLEVLSNQSVLYSEPLDFSNINNSKIINVTLPANSVGINTYQARLVPLENEQNEINNVKNFAVEVIDQKTKIALVSDFLHPDLGALKKSIETNEQRSVDIVDPINIVKKLNDYQLVILNQPNNRFKNLVDRLTVENKNSFIIAGPKTDLTFLASNFSFTQENTNQTEEYQPNLNTNYTPFYVEDIDFESFPPLLSNYGSIKFSQPYQTILGKTLGNSILNEPLLATYEEGSKRQAILFGEGIWKWRAQSFLNKKSFNDFDNFIGKLVQYLASNKQRQRLNVEYESFYNGNSGVIIKAQFFDKNYVFDARESLNISLTDVFSEEKKTFPFVLKNNNYQVDLSGLQASKYNFTVSTTKEKMSQSGTFEILEYDVEKQFLNADVTNLEQLATNSNGKPYFIADTSETLIQDLLNDDRYKPIQKSNKNVIPLIDWEWLLLILALSLSSEWFLRKYHGLI